ncbi:uncharacterized protein J4E87_004230 [Alternaria ethzedia]|uniref:uncharacterized protein n=1 Tax=Alternaria ethzedia TaxID=181014 RepID=UPI0020C5ACFB|nr:uncharacterized protein J4E87_004230 [Alternaria ethzedia]KAI4626889.1 hypothetical protein J4E87_004230 [Alternaria ethzedia]
MYSIRRGCQSALLRSDNICLYANGSRRAFSRTAVSQRGALPNFLPPSSPELSKLLSTFNSQILLPEHLTKEQQKLVYSQESRAKLEAEPIEITLGEVTLPLEHLDRNRLPNRYKRLREICNQSETKEDWENVVRCLEGFQEAGIKVHWQWQELVIRKLNLAGMQHLVLKALQRAKETGVKLNNYGVLRAVLRTVHDKAALADWAQDDTIKAHKLAKQVVELMEDEEHYVGKRPVKPRGKPDKFAEGDYRGRPSVVALPTEMAAVLADRYGGDKEEVKTLSSRLVHALQQSGYTTSLDAISRNSDARAADFVNVTKLLEHITDHCYELLEVLIIWNALKTSRKVLGAEMLMSEEAQTFETRTKLVLIEGVRSLDDMSKNKEGKPLIPAYVRYIKDTVDKTQGESYA